MAHMAQAAGTDYAVAGGKTLIDGTAYSVVATREVEKTIVVTGKLPSTVSGSFTVNDARLDYDKYEVVQALYATAGYYNMTGVTVLIVYEKDYQKMNGIIPGGNYSGASSKDSPSVTSMFNFSQNGKAVLPALPSANLLVEGSIYTIVLEAKT